MSLKGLLPVSIKYSVKRGLSPRGVAMGAGSFIRRPFHVDHPDRIELGRDVTILSGVLLQPITRYAGVAHDPSIVIGDSTYIGRHTAIHAIDRVEIGPECVLSDYIYLSDSSHGFDPDGPPILEQPLSSRGPIHIGRRCFLGYRTVVMPGVTLGERCIVGANSVVTRSFPAGSVVGGAPARLLKQAVSAVPAEAAP